MKPHQINLLNASILIALGLWGYLSSTSPSPTALIPVGFGIVFALATPSLRKENKLVAHAVVLLTIILTLALILPLRGALAREDILAAVRIGVMLAGCVAAIVIYIRGFIEARRTKES
jgi:hypothetical protein